MPLWKPVVAEPAGAVTDTPGRKLPPTLPPISHCWANAPAAAVKNKSELRSVFMESPAIALLHYADRKAGRTAALGDDERHLEALRHAEGNRYVDLVKSDITGHQAGPVDVQRLAADRYEGLAGGRRQRLRRRRHAILDRRRRRAHAGQVNDQRVVDVDR